MPVSDAHARRLIVAHCEHAASARAIPWLQEHYRADIVAVTMDVGQGADVESARSAALQHGAVRAHVLDVREELARDYVLPALKAEAVEPVDNDGLPNAIAIAWPVTARQLVEMARIEGAFAVAHFPRSSERQALPTLLRSLQATLDVVMVSAAQGGWLESEVPASRGTLWGRITEIGRPVDAAASRNASHAAPAQDPPGEPAYVELAFEQGVPVSVNGVAMPLLDLIGSLTTIARVHRTGRVPRARLGAEAAGVHELYEGPAAVVLHTAHAHLRRTVASPPLDRLCRAISLEYSAVIANGLWFTPLRDALDAFVAKVQERVTGSVRLTMFNGDCRVVSSQSPHAVPLEAGEPAGPSLNPAETLAASLR